MELSTEFLARLQFAITIMFHYLFPPLTIGLGLLLVFLEGMYLKTGDKIYETATRFWTRLFGVNFALGVATGIVMEFQFGTNWATYSRYVGDVFGSALAAEGIFAFFLESGFLAVLIFGWDKVSARMHFFATLMVALGSMFSAIWIVVANSWMQTPAGFHIVGQGLTARAEITDFWAMVLNPSSVWRLLHTVSGCWILGAFFMMSISAYYILRQRHKAVAQRSFKVALVVAACASVFQAVSGDMQARIVAKYQPAKLAAYEGLYKTPEGGAPFHVFGIPDSKEERIKYGVAIPGLLSWLVYRDTSRPVAGLDQFDPKDRPPVGIPFYSFHLMVMFGVYFILLTLYAIWRWRKGTLFNSRPMMWIFVWSVLGPYAANQLGWIATEVGRQPWIVQGLLRTSEALSKSVKAHQILSSIIMFLLIYTLLFMVWLYVSNDKIQHGPDEPQMPPKTPTPGLIRAATARADPSGPSMTQNKGED
jgi:cytochrome bd ubiquinol oxidase subunit I